jgi:hypothetical protein
MGAADDMRGRCWSRKGRARAKGLFTTVWRPTTACQSTCLEENALQRTPSVGVQGRPSRNGNWSNAQRHNRNGYWSNVPREAVPIRSRLESEWGLKLYSSVGWWWPQYTTGSLCGRKSAPVQTPGHCRRMTRAYWPETLCNPAGLSSCLVKTM